MPEPLSQLPAPAQEQEQAPAAQDWARYRAAYRADPGQSEALLAQLLALAAPRVGLAEYACFVATLALEARQPRVAAPLLRQALQAAQALPPAQRAELHVHLARADIQQLHFDDAREHLTQARALGQQAPLVQALVLAARALLAHREGAMAESVAWAHQALQAFLPLAWEGPWVQVYATLAVALRALGDQAGRAAALSEGQALCQAQRRWGEAANLCTGRFDMALEAGALAQARQVLDEGNALAERAGGGPEAPGRAMQCVSHGRWLAAQGRHAEACDSGAREALASLKYRLAPFEYALRMNELADWLVAAGRPQEGLQAACEAQQVEAQNRDQSSRRDLALLAEQLAIEAAEQQRAHSEAHAQRLERQQAELAATLQRQRELQDELVEARKLAGLGQLLVGLAQSLEPPLRTGLQALQRAQQEDDALLAQLQAGSPTRRGLQQGLQSSLLACQQAQGLLQGVLQQVDSYRELRDEA